MTPLLVGLVIRLLDEVEQSHLTTFISRYIALGRFKFFLETSNYAIPPSIEQLNFLDCIAAIASFICTQISAFYSYFAEGLLLMGCLTLWTAVKNFQTWVELKGGTTSINLVIKEYDALKEFCHLINDATSNIVFGFVLNGIMYYSSYINLIFIVENSTSDKLSTLFYAVNFCTILFFCGDLSERAGCMRRWLQCQIQTEQNHGIRMKEFVMILHDSSDHTVAISGICFKLYWTTIFSVIFRISHFVYWEK